MATVQYFRPRPARITRRLKALAQADNLTLAAFEHIARSFPSHQFELKKAETSDAQNLLDVISGHCVGDFLKQQIVEELQRAATDIAILPGEQLPYPLPAELTVVALLKSLVNQTLSSDELYSNPDQPLAGQTVVLARKNRADLRVLFSKIDLRPTYGQVYLVGAGVGAADLLTLRAHRLLKTADIIFYDSFINDDILARYSCVKRYVGKKKGEHSLPQEIINAMMFEAAVTGKRVVRLKGGDPFIFGRGGEELAFLQQRLVDVHVVPAPSAMQVAAASALFPLTQRGLANSLILISAHCTEPGASETQVYYMGVTKRAEIRAELLAQGKSPDTPVALIQNAGAPEEQTTITTLDKMPQEGFDSPGLIVVGEVVRHHQPPERILYTGLNPARCPVRGELVFYPLIERRARVGNSARTKSLYEIVTKRQPVLDLNRFDGIVFTCPAAVTAFFEHYEIVPPHLVCFVYGGKTKQFLRRKQRMAHIQRVRSLSR